MPTNMTIFKSSKYSYLRICNVDDAKVMNRIYICSKLIFQPESIKHHTKMGNQNKQNHDEITKTNERKLKLCGNHLFN